MIVVTAIVLTVLTFIFIAYPIFRQRSTSADSVYDEKLDELHTNRDTAYSMLKELEFDYHSGILSKDDYRELEKRYKQKAISILKEADKLEAGTDVDEEIEKQVTELRRGEGQFCTQCGKKYQAGDRFCAQCGANLR